jgi:hypothetical protein
MRADSLKKVPLLEPDAPPRVVIYPMEELK